MGFAGGVGYTNIDLIYSGIDRLPEAGEEIYAEKFGIYLGGGIPATLINTARLGVPSRAVTFVGKDYFSEFVYQSFEKCGAQIVNLYEGDGMPVTVSATMVCKGDRSFLSYVDKVEVTGELEEKIYRQLTGAKVVDMGVGFPGVNKRLKKEGTIQVFDTGWEDDLSLDKYREYLEIADYYLPNQKEAMKITGEDTVEGAAEKLSRYFHDVIIKLDRDGCMLRNEKGTRIIPPLEGVEAVDSTGAGDAFMSGFLYGIYHDCPVEQCIRFGNITGGTCVQGIGCLTRYVEEAELLRLAGMAALP